MPPPQQKPVTPSLPDDSACALRIARAVQHVGAQLALVEAGLQRAAVIVVAGIAADGKQAVGRQRQKPFGRGAARHVLDVGIEPAILVDHQHDGKRPVALGLHQVAAHGAGGAARRRVGHVAGLDALVGEGDRLGVRVTRQQRLRHGEAADRHDSRLLQEGAAIDPPVAVFVIEIDRRAGRSRPASTPAAPQTPGQTALHSTVRLSWGLPFSAGSLAQSAVGDNRIGRQPCG